MVYLTSGASPLRSFLKSGDCSTSRNLMSFCKPGRPKKECQIQRLWVATASRTIVATWISGGEFSTVAHCLCVNKKNLLFCFLDTVLSRQQGKFFHCQCIQSRDPSIPGKPHFEFIAVIHIISSSVVYHTNFSLYKSMTELQNSFKACDDLLLEIWTYSSFRSAAPPYASIRRAEVIL
jgi:hypothetical protein